MLEIGMKLQMTRDRDNVAEAHKLTRSEESTWRQR